MSTEITLGPKYHAIVDDELYETINTKWWYANIIGGRPYAVSNCVLDNGRRGKILLHRLVYELVNGKLPPGANIKWANHNTLDCRIENLYISKRTPNTINKSNASKPNTTKSQSPAGEIRREIKSPYKRLMVLKG